MGALEDADKPFRIRHVNLRNEIGIDATTLEANAAMKSIERCDTAESYADYLRRRAKAGPLARFRTNPLQVVPASKLDASELSVSERAVQTRAVRLRDGPVAPINDLIK